MPHTHVELSQTGIHGCQNDEHDHLKIRRLNENLPTDKSHYMMAAIGEVIAGEPIPVHYPGPTIVYVIEGEVHYKDKSKPDEVSKLFAGDLIHIDHGSYNTLFSPNEAKLLGVSYIPSHLHPEDFVLKK